VNFELRLARPSSDSADRARMLVDEADVLRTMNVYCHAMDYGHPQLWAECFTEQGVYAANMPDGAHREIVGREALAAYAGAHQGAPVKFPKHMFWAPVIDFDGARAKATAMFAVVNDTTNGPAIEVFGVYDDELVRETDGVWRSVRRVSNVEAVTSTFRAARVPR
jgi:SnoaL-like domain